MFPPGYRFNPSVIELLVHYLRNKILNPNFTCEQIIEENVYLHHPSILINKYREKGEDAWYFFSPRERKYRNGDRPDRQAGGGSWKASGASKVIAYKNGIEIGKDTALVYYDGRINRNKGVKTDWMMHEFWSKKFQIPLSEKNMKLDDWVICKIYKTNRKNGKGKKFAESEKSEDIGSNSSPSPNPSPSSDPNPCSEQMNTMVKIEQEKPLVKEKGVQIREELVSQEKAPKGNSKCDGKGKEIQTDDGEKHSLKALRKTMKCSREEIHSGAPTNHASSSSSSAHPGSQHAFPVYCQRATLQENNQNLGGIYDQSAPLYDEQVRGACGQNAYLGESSQFIRDFCGQPASLGGSSQLISDFQGQLIGNFGSQNVYLDQSYQFDASGFGQNPHDQIIDPMDYHFDIGVDDLDFDNLGIDGGEVDSLLEEFGGSLDYIGFLREDDDGNSPLGAKESSSSSLGN